MNRMKASRRRASRAGRGAVRACAASGGGRRTADGSGEYLARAGDCVACHSVPGGKAFAGGLKMGTPLGRDLFDQHHARSRYRHRRLHASRISTAPCAQASPRTGTGSIPPCPIPPMPRSRDDDLHALYDFFMKEVPPVKQANKPSEIPAYLSFRWPLAIWNMMFTDSGPYVAKPAHDAAWNRGAYLVEGLGHCGACHTPRGWAFQEKALDDGSGAYLQGAELDAWSAPDLRGDLRTGLGAWSQEDLATFLKTGHNGGWHRVRLDARCRQQQHALFERRRCERDGRLSEIAACEPRSRPRTRTTAPPPTALQSGKPQAGGRSALPRQLRVVPRRRRQGPEPRTFRRSPAMRWCSTAIRPRSSISC